MRDGPYPACSGGEGDEIFLLCIQTYLELAGNRNFPLPPPPSPACSGGGGMGYPSFVSKHIWDWRGIEISSLPLALPPNWIVSVKIETTPFVPKPNTSLESVGWCGEIVAQPWQRITPMCGVSRLTRTRDP